MLGGEHGGVKIPSKPFPTRTRRAAGRDEMGTAA